MEKRCQQNNEKGRKKQKGGFPSIILTFSLLQNLLTGKEVSQASEGNN